MRMTLIDEVRKHKAAKRGTLMTLWTDVAPAGDAFDIEDFTVPVSKAQSIGVGGFFRMPGQFAR